LKSSRGAATESTNIKLAVSNKAIYELLNMVNLPSLITEFGTFSLKMKA
jgi:hypothetical protein